MNVETLVSERYAEGAKAVQEALCCPVDYDTSLLKMLPTEIIERDYGCGDPSRYVREGDVVLDLGSGGGKICYMAAQIVGEQGAVIGVDMTDDMLELARSYQDEMASKLGSDRVDFRKGYIQDLALDVSALEQWLAQNPVKDLAGMQALEQWKQRQRADSPLVEDDSVSLVVSNCVLNLVAQNDRAQMLREVFRVLKPGGRVAISDIVCDEPVPQHLQDDAQLWSGCISGAFQEKEFVQAFLDAGFVGVAYDKWESEPWQVVEGIEFRSVTLVATKPSRQDLYDGGDAVLYRGPFSKVEDDLGNVYCRGDRTAVSRRTFELLTSGDYQEHFVGMSPAEEINNGCFCKPAGTLRPAAETKGASHAGGNDSGGCC
ncbi:methyltransferase domain-containing protein [Pseudomaricurvus alkylphenolicus]|jgi:ubiquinone/menaquinone biosynthesis C-methylase UbiE|uniref:methyltransferase domain-containing protein n=1 Tax=Pseudomaricurvus alkylphenolicus TaxID=1306991 RepID=UPI00141E5F6E|nr:methyltransferase domain-containing protein [Pseudomaricurvus alkylphenolicus]NIB39393.1 methyltransferase domain-containing protein [Pseudomaricurvus alkylphenolicus]